MQHGQQSSPHCDRDKQVMNGRLACRSRDTGYVSKVFEYFRMQFGMGPMFLTAVRSRVACGRLAERAFGNVAVMIEFITKQTLLA